MSSKDVYGFDAEYSGVALLSAKEMELVVSGGASGGTGGATFLIQNVVMNYQQPVQTIRELGSADAYYLGMPPVGSLSIDRIVGSKKITDLLGPYGEGLWVSPKGDESDARLITLKPIKGTGGTQYLMYGCVITSFGNTMSASNSMVQDSIQMMFGSLSLQ